MLTAVLWFEAGIGNEVLQQSEETKLQCVIKTSSDPSGLDGVSFQINMFLLSLYTPLCRLYDWYS